VFGSELDDYYRRSRVLAIPAPTELDSQTPRGKGFGIVFLEVMAHGKPVLRPCDGGPSEFIRSREHGLLVDPTDLSTLANALVELLEDEDRDRVNRMNQVARVWVTRSTARKNFESGLERYYKMNREPQIEITV
jgi:glycosyltransferase involved in cell wall biosynthesis